MDGSDTPIPLTPISFDVPDGACDCHFHIFGPPDKFPFAETRRYTPPGGPFEHFDTFHLFQGDLDKYASTSIGQMTPQRF